LKKSIAILLFSMLVASCFAQQTEIQQNLQEGIQARYRLTAVGPSALGLKGGDDSIRKLGGTILVMKKGLFGAIDRKQIVSNAITNGKRTLLAGKEDIELQPGERFYANKVTVGPDFVSVGLLSVDSRTMQDHVGRVWAAVNFFFPPEVIKTGDVKAINAAMDQWLLPADSLPNMPVNPAKTFVVAGASLPPTVDLKPGMTKEEIVADLGTPAQTIGFGNRTWLTYPALVAVLEDGKLSSVDRAEDSAGKISLGGEAGSEIYIDGELAGTTPTSLRVPVGSHKVELKAEGKTVWTQDVRVFPGADINLKPAMANGN
jgi:hypothetical protein